MSWHDLPKGRVGAYDNNEVEIVATDDDPAGLRGGKKRKAGDGFNLFKVSGDVVRDDGRHEEYVCLRFRLAPNEKDGAVELILRNEQGQEQAIYYVDPKGFHFGVPVHAPNLSGAGGTFLKNGPWELHLQGDGNLVLYDVRATPWKALWNSGTNIA